MRKGFRGTGHTLVVSAPRIDGFDWEFADLDFNDGFSIDAVRDDLRDQCRAGCRLDLAQPFIEGFFSERHPLNAARIAHPDHHRAALRVCKGHQGCNAGFIKRGFEF